MWGLYFRKLQQGLQLLESGILETCVLWFTLPDLRLATLVLVVSHNYYKENLNDSDVTFVSACILVPGCSICGSYSG